VPEDKYYCNIQANYLLYVCVWCDYHIEHKIPLNSKQQLAFIMQMCG